MKHGISQDVSARCAIWLLATLGFPVLAVATKLVVSPVGSGTACTLGAPCGLQQALAIAAGNGQDDTVVLVAGTYASASAFQYQALAGEDRSLTVTAADDAAPGSVVIDGQLARRALGIASSAAAGLTGSHFSVRGLTLVNGVSVDFGGGLRVTTAGGNVSIEACAVSNSTATLEGGGAYLESSAGSVTVKQAEFSGNQGEVGGGVYLAASVSASIADSRVQGNVSTNSGAGVTLVAPVMSMQRCRVAGNRTAPLLSGGGVYVWQTGFGASLTLTDNLITGNIAGNGGGVKVGLPSGGGICYLGNNTVTGNQGTVYAGAAQIEMAAGQRVDVVNNILWGNPSNGNTEVWLSSTSGANTLTHNDVHAATGAWTETNGNLDADPGFVDPTAGEYHLRQDSSLVDAGTLEVPDPPGLSAMDVEGGPRLIGTAPDIGAWELFVPGPLTAHAVSSPWFGAAPLSTRLVAQVTGGAPPYSFAWDFGDGTAQAYSQVATHNFTGAGSYEPTVRVKDSGSTAVTSHTEVVAGPGCALTCDALVPADGTVGQERGFEASAQTNSCTGPPTFEWDFGDGTPHATGPGDGSVFGVSHVYAVAGGFDWQLTVRADGRVCTRAGRITIAPGSSVAYLVPAIAHLSGYGGVPWRSDVAVVNRSGTAAQLAIAYYSDGQPIVVATTLADGGALEWRNIAETLLSFSPAVSTSGSLVIGSNVPVAVTARNYAAMPDGTYGQEFTALTASSGVTAHQVGILPQLRKNSTFYVNVGLVNLGIAPCTVRVTLFGPTGASLGSAREVTVGAQRWRQENKIFDSASAGDQEIAYATVEVLTEGCRAWAYASLIDDRTKDPTTIPLLVQ